MHRVSASKYVMVVLIGFLVILTCPKTCSAQNYEQTYFLREGQSTYELTLSITPSLYQYYQQKDHQLTQNNFATFVTPYSLAPAAVDIRSIFPDDEDFANAVLMLVHQIPYEVVEEAEYPVETIVEDRGDCDLLSFVASSLIKSQHMDVVLFYYRQESHLNIGVNLPSPPRHARTAVTFVDHAGTRYYMAECTGGDWQSGWRVGECPPDLEGTPVTVITLENSEQVAPGQVSSSFGALKTSVVSLGISSSFVMEGNVVVVAGQVSVSNPGGTVTLYAAKSEDWSSIGTATLDSSGRYSFSWEPVPWGQYYMKASWSGDSEYAGADSEIVPIYIVPRMVVFAAGLAFMAIIAVAIFAIFRITHPEETQTLDAASE